MMRDLIEINVWNANKTIGVHFLGQSPWVTTPMENDYWMCCSSGQALRLSKKVFVGPSDTEPYVILEYVVGTRLDSNQKTIRNEKVLDHLHNSHNFMPMSMESLQESREHRS